MCGWVDGIRWAWSGIKYKIVDGRQIRLFLYFSFIIIIIFLLMDLKQINMAGMQCKLTLMFHRKKKVV